MPRRKDTNEWKTDGRGRYRRMVGWKDDGGKRVQQPFYFGTDLDQAKARYLRVRELWAHLERIHESSKSVLNSKFELPAADSECLWDSQSLWVARELAAGRVQIMVPLGSGVPATAYVSLIDSLAKRYPMVYFVPEEPETYRAGKDTWQLYVEGEQKRIPLPLANAAPHASATASSVTRQVHRAHSEDGPRTDARRPPTDRLRAPEGRAGSASSRADSRIGRSRPSTFRDARNSWITGGCDH